ncbi:geranylgeranyl reductase family protein [Rhodobacter maris]|uniref:Geranylgeranyl reductase family protein n=1 Tax=Rhodobacter maris TaxID=446682 RepID=A0A285SAS3_9RHOB|nr:geranylgeranyl reductase family protein [Rhodobacter maris]SOC02512.1 geranylgeranyl reductase family protein [Rhodobacter maris]
MNEDLDVLVIGLGPAGASAAAAAARAGARVLAVDRRATPGDPVQCAEFVPRALGAETRALRAAAVQEIAAMESYVSGTHLRSDDFRGMMIDRAAFDAALVAEARAAGAGIVTGVALEALTEAEARLGDNRRFRARVVIGGDGPQSRVGAAVGLVNRDFCEARQITVPLRQPHDATDIFLAAEIPGGYGWLFPRGAEANLGLGVAWAERACLKPLLEALHAELVAEGRVGRQRRRLTGGMIPVGGLVGPLGHLGRLPVLLAGDAAGLTHPITGAGIASACLSGAMAGEAAAQIVAGRAGAAADYAEEIADLFGPTLRLALARRAELMAHYVTGAPDTAALRRAWVAYSDYRDAPLPSAGGSDTAAVEARIEEPA